MTTTPSDVRGLVGSDGTIAIRFAQPALRKRIVRGADGQAEEIVHEIARERVERNAETGRIEALVSMPFDGIEAPVEYEVTPRKGGTIFSRLDSHAYSSPPRCTACAGYRIAEYVCVDDGAELICRACFRSAAGLGAILLRADGTMTEDLKGGSDVR